MKEIPLHNGQTDKVDDVDYKRLNAGTRYAYYNSPTAQKMFGSVLI